MCADIIIVRCAAVAAFAALPLAAAGVEAEEARMGGQGRSHWHVWPFFEYLTPTGVVEPVGHK